MSAATLEQKVHCAGCGRTWVPNLHDDYYGEDIDQVVNNDGVRMGGICRSCAGDSLGSVYSSLPASEAGGVGIPEKKDES